MDTAQLILYTLLATSAFLLVFLSAIHMRLLDIRRELRLLNFREELRGRPILPRLPPQPPRG